MIRLVSKYRKNLLADTHLSIAQRIEREGNLKQAEHHYVQAGAWHGAVEMYKNNGLWEDAIRVCRINGSEKETSELAKKWAETLGPEAGMKMLLKMNLVDAVIEYLIERNEFQEAFKMANQNAKHKIRDVHLKYAFYLEDERRYKEAEEEFIKAGKPNEAISMYEHQEDWVSALQIARQYDPQSVNSILLNQGRSCMQKRDIAKAEQCFVQAKKPEIAIKMYMELGQQQEAIRVARKHAPQLLPQIQNNIIDAKGLESMSGEELLNAAKLREESREWVQAIETYLEIKREHFPNDPDTLESAWERAVHLAMTYDKGRMQEIVSIVCKRLRDIKRFEPAAELYENMGMYEEAVSCFIAAKNFSRALGVTAQMGNTEQAQRLKQLIQQHQIGKIAEEGNADELVSHDAVRAIDLYVQKGEWDRALEVASQTSPDVLVRYLMKYAKAMMEAGKFGETIAAFAKYGFPYIPNYFNVYKTLILEIFAECDPQEIKDLRKALYDLYSKLEQHGENNTPIGKEFGRYFNAAHLVNLKFIYDKKNLQELSAKVAISLLRYGDLIRVDKLYYDAGTACRKLGWTNLAHILLNRYLDIYEVIEDPEGGNLADAAEYAVTDFPPISECPLPEKNLIPEKEKQEMSEWLVQVSMKQKIDPNFTTRTCDVCKNKIAEFSLGCPSCKTNYPMDCITGYPALKGNSVPCNSCGRPSTKENWQSYLQNFANCPWCNNLPN